MNGGGLITEVIRVVLGTCGSVVVAERKQGQSHYQGRHQNYTTQPIYFGRWWCWQLEAGGAAHSHGWISGAIMLKCMKLGCMQTIGSTRLIDKSRD